MGSVTLGVLCAVMALLASGCTALPEAAPVTTAIVDPTLLVVAEEARAAGALSAGLLASPVVVRVSPQPASEKRPPLVPLKQAKSAAAGAIASAILALAADLSREEQRPKVMATIGMFIGLSFTIAMIIGPIVAQAFGLSGLFWFIAILTIFAMLTIQFIVPNSVNTAPKGDNVALPSKLGSLIRDGQLSRLNWGVFILHMALTACFVTLPKQFVANGLALEQHWQLYLPTLIGSFFLMVPFMIIGLKKQKETQMFSAAVALLTLALLLLWYLPTNITTLIILVMMFFTAFNYLEATMPSILSRIAPAGVKGSVMGIYSSSQFLGAFAGGILGGFIAGEFGEQTIFLVTGLFSLVWLFLTLGMKPLKKSKAYSFSTNINNDEQAHEVAQKLSEMPGVIEVTIMHDEAVAYLKVDDKTVDILSIKALLNE